jgi:hypothetical protein
MLSCVDFALEISWNFILVMSDMPSLSDFKPKCDDQLQGQQAY